MAKFVTYVLNLDRHPDRLARMTQQATDAGIGFERIPAVDASLLSDRAMDALVAPNGPIPRMPKGARACTASHIDMYRRFLKTDADYALILEDDAMLSPDLGADVAGLVQDGDFDILNLNRQTPRGAVKKLVVGRQGRQVAGFDVRRLAGIHYGTAGYLISRHAAQVVLSVYPRPNAPIDHLLFNPNISKLFGMLRIEQAFLALVKPQEDEASSIQTVAVGGSDSLWNKLRRTRAEVSNVPKLLILAAMKRVEVKHLSWKAPE